MNISNHPVPKTDRAQEAQFGGAAAGAAGLGSGKPTEPIKGPVDVITLSDAAKAAIAKANGKSAESPAHITREQFMDAKIASGATAIDVRFGDVVSRIARGISTESLFGAASKSGGGEDVTKLAAADGEPTPATAASQDEMVIPTEANTAAVQTGAPVAGDTVKVAAAIVEQVGNVDLLDLLSSDEGETLEVIV